MVAPALACTGDALMVATTASCAASSTPLSAAFAVAFPAIVQTEKQSASNMNATTRRKVRAFITSCLLQVNEFVR
jgi:hypothetical protein